MNRIERISAILIQLQSKKIVKGQDLASRFNISLRTVYRDMKTLEESGVPIMSEAGTGYSLMEGYRLPPVQFTKEEALSFLTAEKLVEKLTEASTYAIYQSALFKIKAVLRTEDKEHLVTMGDYIEVFESPTQRFDKTTTNNQLQIILESLSQKRVLYIKYYANHNQENSEREIEPVGIFLSGNQWYLIAFCKLREAYRTFRVDRIKEIVLQKEMFSNQHPLLKSYLKEIQKDKKELNSIKIRIQSKYLRYLGDQKFYNGFISEKKVKDETEMTFLSSSLEGFARWYITFGDIAKIIESKALKVRVKEISKEILKNLK